MLTVQINHTYLPNTLVDLGEAINVMTTITLSSLGLPNPRPTPTILELANRSTVKPLGVLEDMMIVVDSWEYLVDLGATINVMTTGTLSALGLPNLRPTPTVSELVDRSTIKPLGVLEDIINSVDSWEYPMDFLVLNIQSNLDGHPLILGRPWLATTNAYIECIFGNMPISNGSSKKSLVLYPPVKPSLVAHQKESLEECRLWADYEVEYEDVRLVLTIRKALRF